MQDNQCEKPGSEESARAEAGAAHRREALAASQDPLPLADIEEVERDFADADAEAARMIS